VEGETNAVGVGIFRSREPAEGVTLYYGARLAYVEAEANREPIPSDSFGFRSSSKAEGHVIAPTLGLEYRFIERLSIGAEISIEHSEVENVSVNNAGSPPPTLRTKTTENETRADVILRFFF
jgi:opacity protein-like surface antigen